MAKEFAVDYIVGPTTKRIYGIKRYQDEIHSRIPAARLNRIEYLQPGSRPLSLARRAIFPFEVLLKARKGKIKHFTSQYLAYLLFLPGMGNSVVTVYDTIFLERYADFSPLLRLFIKLNILGIKRAKRIITISDYSAERICRLLGVEKARIEVVKPGMDLGFFSRAAHRPGDWGAKGSPVVLSLGSEEPRQNMDRVILAVHMLKKEFPGIFFLKAGNPQWRGGREELVALVKKLGLSDRVLFLNYVPDKKLPSLYSSADVFVYPCSSTGWGLPPAEAIACGTPTVTSKARPLPEVVGGGALKVDPQDVGEIAGAVRRLLRNGRLAKSLLRKGRKHLGTLTWGAAARKTEEAYRRMLG